MSIIHLIHRLKRRRCAVSTLEPSAIDYDCDTSFLLRQISESRDFPAVPSERFPTLDATAGQLATRDRIDLEGEPPPARVSYALNPQPIQVGEVVHDLRAVGVWGADSLDSFPAIPQSKSRPRCLLAAEPSPSEPI